MTELKQINIVTLFVIITVSIIFAFFMFTFLVYLYERLKISLLAIQCTVLFVLSFTCFLVLTKRHFLLEPLIIAALCITFALGLVIVKPEELKKRKVDLFQYSVILVGLAGFLFSLAILDTVYDFIIGPGCYSVKLSLWSLDYLGIVKIRPNCRVNYYQYQFIAVVFTFFSTWFIVGLYICLPILIDLIRAHIKNSSR